MKNLTCGGGVGGTSYPLIPNKDKQTWAQKQDASGWALTGVGVGVA